MVGPRPRSYKQAFATVRMSSQPADWCIDETKPSRLDGRCDFIGHQRIDGAHVHDKRAGFAARHDAMNDHAAYLWGSRQHSEDNIGLARHVLSRDSPHLAATACGLMSKDRVANPFLCRLETVGRPIRPSPMKPILSADIEVFFLALCSSASDRQIAGLDLGIELHGVTALFALAVTR